MPLGCESPSLIASGADSALDLRNSSTCWGIVIAFNKLRLSAIANDASSFGVGIGDALGKPVAMIADGTGGLDGIAILVETHKKNHLGLIQKRGWRSDLPMALRQARRSTTALRRTPRQGCISGASYFRELSCDRAGLVPLFHRPF